MKVKMTLAEIFSRSLLHSRVEFARKADNLGEGIEKFYAITANDPAKKNIVEVTTIDTKTGTTTLEQKSLGEFIERFGMQSRWYLI